MASLVIAVGQTDTFQVAYQPAGSDPTVVTLGVDNPAALSLSNIVTDLATSSAKGTLTALAPGAVNITATGPAGPIPLTGADIQVNSASVVPTSGAVTFGTPA